MKKGKVLIIGPVGSGKSTLTKCLLDDNSPVRKTQALNYEKWIIDTPGEYSENPMFYRSLIATSLEAKVLLVIQDSTKPSLTFPPNFAAGFPLKPIGVITKIDHPKANPEKAEELLKQVLPSQFIFHTSAITRQGVQLLKEQILKWL